MGAIALEAVWRRFFRRDETPPADPTIQGPTPSERRWVLPAAAAIFVGLSLYYVGDIFLPSYFSEQHAITLYPGKYRRVVLIPGEPASIAMKAVYAASDTDAQGAALAAVENMVDAGDAEAAFRLGRYYHLESAEPNYKFAFKYYEIAFNEHHAWATNNLGLMYRDGLGVTSDDNKAREYFQMASRQHNPWSYVNLADMSFRGRGGSFLR